jgi:para-aminobenzoate synthetase component 1
MSPKRSIFRELLPPPDVLGTFESVLQLPYPILFDSATAVRPVAQYSFVAADPKMVVSAKGRTVELKDVRSRTTVRHEGRALDFVAELLDAMRSDQDCNGDRDETCPQEDTDREDIPPFHGGAAGYIGYEYGGVLERLPKPEIDDIAIPDVVIGLYDWVIAWNHAAGRAWVIGNDELRVDTVVELLKEYATAQTIIREDDTSRRTEPETLLFNLLSTHQQLESTFTPASYSSAVQQVQEHIVVGEIFQANLSQRFRAPLPCRSEDSTRTVSPAWGLYLRLRAINPAPFASYFDFGDGVIASASPERFLLADADGRVETRPIKGTRPSAATKAMDAAAKDELMKSEKDAAEHIMIVDVLRNDFSRVCLYGSVDVLALLAHERYATVHHLVSTIVGQLRPDMNAIDLLHACFPGGSITGAPKIRAMEVIAQLEPVTRGAYCGTIGYFSTTGAMDTSILIRTYVIKDGQVYFSAGGGIVADSNPAAEYEETLVKARALMRALST